MVILGLSFLAGLLTCLSPCVFPVVPLIVGSSLQRNRLGPLVLAAGLVITFTIVGAILMATGAAVGIDQSLLRPFASILLILAGAVLLSKKLQELLGRLLSPFASRADRSIRSTDDGGLVGQFFAGSMLGILWSPCTGPTMGQRLHSALRAGRRSKS